MLLLVYFLFVKISSESITCHEKVSTPLVAIFSFSRIPLILKKAFKTVNVRKIFEQIRIRKKMQIRIRAKKGMDKS